MWDPAQYELLDFGAGRKLERFAGVLLDRPSPAAEGAIRTQPELWPAAFIVPCIYCWVQERRLARRLRVLSS